VRKRLIGKRCPGDKVIMQSLREVSNSSLLAPTLFIASLLSFVLPSAHKNKVDKEYAAILESLFRVAVHPTRHNISDNDLFAIRKLFFQKVYNSCSNLKNTKVIHVAGTKGKGSNVEYISSAIKHCGYKVGIFTSPHLHTARERIRINSSLISKSDMHRLGKIALSNMKNETWTVFFDLILYVAILYFNEHSVDYIVLETGIGGRYDSTNFIDNPIACVITSISLDHTSILGSTLAAISHQKVGIVKNNSHLFTLNSQNEEVLEVFRAECRSLNAHIHEVNINYDKIKSLNLDLPYTTQQDNVSLSIAVLEYLNIPLYGLKHTFWPCRYEKFNINKTILYIDGY
jgi:folylpolyglutamate synthase/dihydrofolate synthase